MMRFLLLLAILASKFKKSAATNTNFKKFLMGHECRIVVKTKDDKKGKRFIFKDGRFSSDSVLDQSFTAMKKGEDGIMEALQNHLVGIEGQLHAFTWFGAAISFVME